jgi:hypothetical protein
VLETRHVSSPTGIRHDVDIDGQLQCVVVPVQRCRRLSRVEMWRGGGLRILQLFLVVISRKEVSLFVCCHACDEVFSHEPNLNLVEIYQFNYHVVFNMLVNRDRVTDDLPPHVVRLRLEPEVYVSLFLLYLIIHY